MSKNNYPDWFKWKKLYFVQVILFFITILFTLLMIPAGLTANDGFMTAMVIFLLISALALIAIDITVATMIIIMSQNNTFKSITNSTSYLVLGILTIFFGIITSTVTFFMTNSLVKRI